MRSCAAMVIMGLCGGVFPAAAQQLSSKQRNAINHLAQVIAVENYCSEYEGNHLLLGMLMTHYDIDPARPNMKQLFATKYKEQLAGLQAMGTRAGCLIGWSLYGDGGQNVPGLLRKK